MYFSIDMVTRPNKKGSKLTVLKGFQPIVNMGKFWIPEEYMSNFTHELISEMDMITNDKILAKHDDLIDAIAQLTLISILTFTPVGGNEFDERLRMSRKNSYLF